MALSTTVQFLDKTGKKGTKQVSSSVIRNKATAMSVVKVLEAAEALKQNESTLVYSKYTNQLYLGGTGKSISGFELIPSISYRPKKGTNGKLYICKAESVISMWDEESMDYLDIPLAIGSFSATGIIVRDTVSEFPTEGYEDRLYITSAGEGYIYDDDTKEYILVLNKAVADAYTKSESDGKFPTKTDVQDAIDNIIASTYTKTETDNKFPTKTDVNNAIDAALKSKKNIKDIYFISAKLTPNSLFPEIFVPYIGKVTKVIASISPSNTNRDDDDALFACELQYSHDGVWTTMTDFAIQKGQYRIEKDTTGDNIQIGNRSIRVNIVSMPKNISRNVTVIVSVEVEDPKVQES